MPYLIVFIILIFFALTSQVWLSLFEQSFTAIIAAVFVFFMLIISLAIGAAGLFIFFYGSYYVLTEFKKLHPWFKDRVTERKVRKMPMISFNSSVNYSAGRRRKKKNWLRDFFWG